MRVSPHQGRRVLAAATVAALVLSSSTPAGADLSDIRRKKTQTLRVLVVEGAPELFSWDSERPGIEGEILLKFCQLHRLAGYEVVRQPSAAAAIAALLRGEGDVAAGGLTAAGAEALEFTTEVLPSRSVIVTRKPAVMVRSLEELPADRLGAVRGTIGHLNGAGLTVADEATATQGLLLALKSGKLNAGVLGVERAIPARLADPDLQVGMYVGPKISIAFALRKNDPQLRLALNEYIENVRRSATWNRLLLKYFGDSATEILKTTR
jgi:membrane-bound lytic murein transglycosylase F